MFLGGGKIHKPFYCSSSENTCFGGTILHQSSFKGQFSKGLYQHKHTANR